MNKLKEVFVGEDKDSYNEILQWERDLKKYERLKELGNLDTVKELLSEFKKVVDGCNSILLNSADITELERKIVFERRNNYQYFINIFSQLENKTKAIEDRIDENL